MTKTNEMNIEIINSIKTAYRSWAMDFDNATIQSIASTNLRGLMMSFPPDGIGREYTDYATRKAVADWIDFRDWVRSF